ncbi:MAG: pyridoxamine 5'-phosphate oxidase [Phycisphaeraceae bacterium]|nr:pyridoxamine 5'-phosphate oxidase [Phycisphaerales bacterium]MCB9858846.1 pyridoxamine 5'-phosphate oxidase [Phycisphaeraceae bacterium]
MSTPDNQQDRTARDAGKDTIIQLIRRLASCNDIPHEVPADPCQMLLSWFEQARTSGVYDDPNAMSLSTATSYGAPSSRIVLCKSVELSPLAVVFYTSYTSRKASEIESNPRAAALFHWPHAKRQVRIEGGVKRVSEKESDEYFNKRPLLSRIGAAASAQSAPLASRDELITKALHVAKSTMLSGGLNRPKHWGGYRLFAHTVELWSAREGRLHDRVVWNQDPTDVNRWTSHRLCS